jgi:phosphatidylglycerophosphatase A
MYVDEVVLAGIAAVGLCIAFLIGFVVFIANDAKKQKAEAEIREE